MAERLNLIQKWLVERKRSKLLNLVTGDRVYREAIKCGYEQEVGLVGVEPTHELVEKENDWLRKHPEFDTDQIKWLIHLGRKAIASEMASKRDLDFDR